MHKAKNENGGVKNRYTIKTGMMKKTGHKVKIRKTTGRGVKNMLKVKNENGTVQGKKENTVKNKHKFIKEDGVKNRCKLKEENGAVKNRHTFRQNGEVKNR